MTERRTPSTPPAPASRRAGRGRIPLPPAVLARRGGRVLDPAKAGTFREKPLLSTAYVADQLVVQGGSTSAMEALVDAARATKHAIGTRSEEPDAYVERLGDAALGSLASSMWVRRMRLAPDRDKGTPADAWEVLRRYRENVGDAPQDYTVGLNHLVHLTAPSGDITGNPLFDGPALEGNPLFDGPAYFEGNPLFDGPSESSGALRGRAPLAFLGHPPAPAPGEARTRRPVVAVLDTGLGAHPWLTEPWVTLGASVNGQRIGLGADDPDPELTGVVNDPLGGGLDKDSGHGTFIAGIVRQVCPDALVLAIRVMPSDGVVDEHQLTIALNQLLVRQAQAQLLGAPTRSSTSCPCRWATTTSRRRTSSTPRRSRAPSTSSAAGRLRGRLRRQRLHDQPDVSGRPGPGRWPRRPPGSRSARQRRSAEPQRHGRPVLQRRRLGQLPPAGGRGHQHLPHDLRRRARAAPAHPPR